MCEVRIQLTIVMLIVCISIVGCASRNRVEDWSVIALIDGNNEEAQNLVRASLEKHNIHCRMAGSLIYEISVLKDQMVDAKRILLADPELRQPWLIVAKEGKAPFPRLKERKENSNRDVTQ